MAVCPNCGKPLLKGTYCSLACQQELNFKERFARFMAGELNVFQTARTLRKAVIHRDDYKCACCGISEWNQKPITLEVEHKDGNGTNNVPENLCLLCPNCHSQTSTYKAKNRGNGRHSRRQRYAEGKSY